LRKVANERASLLTPIAKAFSTGIGIEVASLGVQVQGGMGFIEETGAASIIATHASPLSIRRHQRHHQQAQQGDPGLGGRSAGQGEARHARDRTGANDACARAAPCC
jgi:alkylation response protein AidB-like acyl-CoA dehydrogenase